MHPSFASEPVDLRRLRLDTAQALLGTPMSAQEDLRQHDPEQYLQGIIDGLCELSLRDPLTGLANRRQFTSVLERETDRVARSGETGLLLMLDIDHFKSVNDTHGHPAGDAVLVAIAKTLTRCVRPMDTIARYGGEEFAVVLPTCQAAFGFVVAERIRKTIENTPIAISSTTNLSITVSVGGAFALQWIRSTPLLWMDRADHELYRAKTQGRNRVCIEQQPDSTVTAEEKSLLFDSLYGPSGWIEPSSLQPVDSAN